MASSEASEGREAPRQAPGEKFLGNRRARVPPQIPATRAWAVESVNGNYCEGSKLVPGSLGSMDTRSFLLWDRSAKYLNRMLPENDFSLSGDNDGAIG